MAQSAMPQEVSRRYRDRVIFGPFTAFSPEEARAFEAEIGRPLPPAYRAFLEVANGGRLEYAVRVPPTADRGVKVFSELFHLGRDDNGEYGAGTLLGEYRGVPGSVFAEAFDLPVGSLLPIGSDGGNKLFLDLSPEGCGEVLAYCFGMPEWTGRGPRQDMGGVLAEDFHHYLDALFIDEESAEWAWRYYLGRADPDPWRQTIEEWLDQGLPGWR